MKKLLMTLWLLLWLIIGGISEQTDPFADVKVNLITDPQPTHLAETIGTLKLVHTIPPDISDEVFLGRVGKIQADDEGNIYVYDYAQHMIFKFDREYRFVKTFLRTGGGPGANSPTRGIKDFRIGPDDRLYFADPGHRKMMVYSLEGEFIEEWRFFKFGMVHPVPIHQGQEWITHTARVLGFVHRKTRFGLPLLSIRDMTDKLLSNPGYLHMADCWVDSFDSDTYAVVDPDSAQFFLFQNHQLQRRFRIIPRRWVRGVKEMMKGAKKNDGVHYPFFTDFFVDRDRPGTFYIGGLPSSGKISNPLYRFDTRGRLLSAWVYPQEQDEEDSIYIEYDCKRNGLIYATDFDHILIFKEEE